MNIVCGGFYDINKYDFLGSEYNFIDSCEKNLVGEDFWTVMEAVLPTPSSFFPMASIDNTVLITGISKDYQ